MAAFPHRIIFIRHGETNYNAENRLQGQRDIPLNPRGEAQAEAVGRMLRDTFAEEIARLEASNAFFASPLVRTRATMSIARAEMKLAPPEYNLVDTLKELSFGQWEGFTWSELRRQDAAGVAAREADKWNFTPPGGESYATLAKRVEPWLAARDGDCFVASHGGVARAFMNLLAGVSGEAAADAPIWQGRALVFDKGGFAWVG